VAPPSGTSSSGGCALEASRLDRPIEPKTSILMLAALTLVGARRRRGDARR
jgi:hypothetical protein